MNALTNLIFIILLVCSFYRPACSQGGHFKKIDALAFSEDGSLLLSGGHDGILILWDENGEKVKIIKPERSAYNRDIGDLFTKVVIFDDRNSFVAGALSHAYLGNIQTGEIKLIPLDHSIGPRGIDISSDGQYILCCNVYSDPGLELRRASGTQKGELVKTHNEKGASEVLSIKNIPDRFACSGQLNGIKIMDLSGKVYAHFPTLTGMEVTAVSDDGKYLVKGNVLYNTESVKKIKTLPIKGWVADVDFTSEGKIVTCHDKEVNVWDVSGKKLQTINHDRQVTQVAISPEGKLLVFGDEKGQLKMYTVSGKFIQDYK